MKKLAPCFILLLVAFAWPAQRQTRTASDYYEAARQAYKVKDYQGFVQNLQKVLKAGTNHPRVFYNLAAGYSLLGKTTEAVRWLNKIADAGISYPVEDDPDFAGIKTKPEFRSIVSRFAHNQTPVVRSNAAFTISDPGFIPEGLTFDPNTNEFLAGSILKQKIAVLNANGLVTDFSSPKDGLWSVLGMSVDAQRKVLWVSSSTLEELNAEKKSVSGIFKYDLTSRRFIKSYLLPSDEQHQLGDVIVNQECDAYSTDSLNPGIYRISHVTDSLEKIQVGDLFRSPQGLCFSEDAKILFVADYVRGIFAIDLKAKAHKNLRAPENVTLAGIDGLYQHKGSLIATQNGFSPNRILRIELNAAKDMAEHVSILEASPPVNGEITLATIVGNDLYYVSNSQLEMYLQDRTTKLQPATIRKIPLSD